MSSEGEQQVAKPDLPHEHFRRQHDDHAEHDGDSACRAIFPAARPEASDANDLARARHAEGARRPEQFLVDRLRAVLGVIDQRQRHGHDDDEYFRGVARAEPQHDERQQRRLRHRIDHRQQRRDEMLDARCGPATRPSGTPRTSPERKADGQTLQRTGEVGPDFAAAQAFCPKREKSPRDPGQYSCRTTSADRTCQRPAAAPTPQRPAPDDVARSCLRASRRSEAAYSVQ